MMSAVWRTSPGTCSDHASHSRSRISEKPSTSIELTQDDIPGASLNEPFHGILKVCTFTPMQANG